MRQLEDLLISRASIFDAKVKVLEEYLDKIDSEDHIANAELNKFKTLHETFSKASHRAGSEQSVFCQSV